MTQYDPILKGAFFSFEVASLKVTVQSFMGQFEIYSLEIRKYMERSDAISQEEIAQFCGLSQPSISRIKSGTTPHLTENIARKLDVFFKKVGIEVLRGS